MVDPLHTPTREELQAVFARAAGRRAGRRVFVETLRQILTRREALDPLLVVKPDRRRVHRKA